MTSQKSNTLYSELIDVFYDYLGPAAQRFLDREIEAHLGKKPDDITREDIPKIHEWSRLAIALLAEDQQTVNNFSESIMALAKNYKGD